MKNLEYEGKSYRPSFTRRRYGKCQFYTWLCGFYDEQGEYFPAKTNEPWPCVTPPRAEIMEALVKSLG